MAQGYALAVAMAIAVSLPPHLPSHSHTRTRTQDTTERCVKNMATHPFVFRVFVNVFVSHFIFMPAHVLPLFLLYSSFLFARLMFVLCFSERFYLRLSVAHFPLFRRHRRRLAFDKWLLACQSADLGFDFGIPGSEVWGDSPLLTPFEDPKVPPKLLSFYI